MNPRLCGVFSYSAPGIAQTDDQKLDAVRHAETCTGTQLSWPLAPILFLLLCRPPEPPSSSFLPFLMTSGSAVAAGARRRFRRRRRLPPPSAPPRARSPHPAGSPASSIRSSEYRSRARSGRSSVPSRPRVNSSGISSGRHSISISRVISSCNPPCSFTPFGSPDGVHRHLHAQCAWSDRCASNRRAAGCP